MGKYIIEWLLKVIKVSDNLLTKDVKLVLLIGEDQQMQNLLPAQQKSELFFWRIFNHGGIKYTWRYYTFMSKPDNLMID